MDSSNGKANLPEKIKVACSKDVKKWHEQTDEQEKYKAWRAMRNRMYLQADREQISDNMWTQVIDDDMNELDHFEDMIEKAVDKVLKKFNINKTPAEVHSTVDIGQISQCSKESCANANNVDSIKATLQHLHNKKKSTIAQLDSPNISLNNVGESKTMCVGQPLSGIGAVIPSDVSHNINASPSAHVYGVKPSPSINANEHVPPSRTLSGMTNSFVAGTTVNQQPSEPSVPYVSTSTGDGRNGNNIFAHTPNASTASLSSVQSIGTYDTSCGSIQVEDSSSASISKVPDYLRLPCKPSKFVSTYRSIQSSKRSSDDDGMGSYSSDAKRGREEENEPFVGQCDFKTGTEELKDQYAKKYGNPSTDSSVTPAYAGGGRTLGARAGRNVRSKFVPPVVNEQQHQQRSSINTYAQNGSNPTNNHRAPQNGQNHSMDAEADTYMGDDERLRNIEPSMIERIQNEIMHQASSVDWDSIAGLDYAKTIIKEAVIWPMIRPELFKGLRRPPKGILLFGPPGTGKTMIGKCIASQANATFFSISASSLTSKWIGEGEKMVRALFAVANVHQPSVIFIDEIDSLLCQRSDTEHESSRRLKTEFLVQLDGATTSESDRVLIVGATNRPQELDEAARRRLVKRLYIPLPEPSAREQMLFNLLKSEKVVMSREEVVDIARLTDGYSGADMKALCSEAAMGPIREIAASNMFTINPENVRPMNYHDLVASLKCVKATVSPKDLNLYVEWNETFGSGSGI